MILYSARACMVYISKNLLSAASAQDSQDLQVECVW